MSEVLGAERAGSGSRLEFNRIEVVVNPASGGVDPGAPEQLQALMDEAEREANVVEATPDTLDQCLKSALEADPDLLILLAGDGTARAAASLAGPTGPLLAPLAGGTMNMLPHAIYGRRPWQEALADIMQDGVEKQIGGGVVGEHRFYVAAILGAPALWAHAREAVRKRDLKEAVEKARYAWSRAFSRRINFALGAGPRQQAEALTLLCPLVSRAMSETEEALEIDALDPKGAAEAFRLGFRALVSEFFGDWRDDPAVTARKCDRARAWASSPIPAILDGEPTRMPKQVDIRFDPCAFRALAPRPIEETEAGETTEEGLSEVPTD